MIIEGSIHDIKIIKLELVGDRRGRPARLNTSLNFQGSLNFDECEELQQLSCTDLNHSHWPSL